jgi:predicted ABC-type transport system involved in lysophospholipase L1 biosynthesis ATPase subunit
MATHDVTVAERCHRRYYMDGGALHTERPAGYG